MNQWPWCKKSHLQIENCAVSLGTNFVFVSIWFLSYYWMNSSNSGIVKWAMFLHIKSYFYFCGWCRVTNRNNYNLQCKWSIAHSFYDGVHNYTRLGAVYKGWMECTTLILWFYKFCIELFLNLRKALLLKHPL